MIGGYVFRDLDTGLDARLRDRLADTHTLIDAWDRGYLFHDDCFGDGHLFRVDSGGMVALSQDLLVSRDPNGEYRELDDPGAFEELFVRDEVAALDSISSEYRMVAVRREGDDTRLYLVSNRAGSGRIYHHDLGSGIVFSSDLRFLLGVIRGEVSRRSIYAILKYGAVPEPLTICEDVLAVPVGHYGRMGLESGACALLPYFRFEFPCDRGIHEGLDAVEGVLRDSSRFLAGRNPAILLSGGIDSSLYGCYLTDASEAPLRGLYCEFGDDDPELQYASAIAKKIGAELRVARMEASDALTVLEEATRSTDHPFSDFSSLPITFVLKDLATHFGRGTTLVECNGGDDCFGFGDLANETKFRIKHGFPRFLKRALSSGLVAFPHWKWKSHEGMLARLSALADVHELSPLDYFLVISPVEFLELERDGNWDEQLSNTLWSVFEACGDDFVSLGYGARTTIRQLLQVNSRRWAAKALSVGESLGIRVVYPYLWREVLIEQGRIPFDAKIKDGVVKWPLKRLLEEHMPESFIHRKKSGFVPPFAAWLTRFEFNQRAREVLLDRGASVASVVPRRVLEALLSDAEQGARLRHSILNFLWGAMFTEMWLETHATRGS